MTMIARHLLITGQVQGVFYRNWTVQTARDLNLAGWVRNKADGRVEAWVEGAPEAVELFIQRAHEGPPAARVANIDSAEVAPEGLTTFDKRPTA
ncbi:Acylphosphatase [Sphingomonas paucimobilis]|uniref:acylphosphatase n=1 Tax=Sphingobium sp. DC-2 TaxID=1303256 RepID=UPI0004492256|nr:acylphosphatase [Sphingobium sp. DC-2]EZP72383.1 Acylphosphatase [Sphingomonas paucimobilis]